MENLKRKEFLKKATLLTVATAFIPDFLFAKSCPKKSGLFDRVVTNADDQGDYRIVDLHCHPSLKMYLWSQHLWKCHLPGPGANEIQMQDDLRQLGYGNLKGLVVAHYLVEAATKRDWNLLKGLFPWINRFLHGLADKIEHEDASNFTQINIMMDLLESQVHEVNQRQDTLKLVIARSYGEFLSASQVKGQVAIAHAIEGGHALGRNFPISETREQEFKDKPAKQHKMITFEKREDPAFYYLRNLEALYNRGVCMITLAHIFKNDLAHPVEGISEDEKKTLGMTWHYDTAKHNCDLSAIGVAVAKRMLELGMVIDLTHSTPAARKNIFEITAQVNEERVKLFDWVPDPVNPGSKIKRFKHKRPLTFTHVGSQQIFMKHNHMEALQAYKFYDIDDFEIDQICETEGVIGIIPENFWLTGADKKISGEGIEPGDYRYGINYIIDTMISINSKTRKKDFSNIAIGTDFDGFADAPKDLYVPKQLAALIEAIRKIPGITSGQVLAITSGNANRLLARGWGDKMDAVNIRPVTLVGTCEDDLTVKN